MKVPTQFSTQSVTGNRKPDNRKEHAVLTDSISKPGKLSEQQAVRLSVPALCSALKEALIFKAKAMR